jgi:predicted PurR-regulated permease PerM
VPTPDPETAGPDDADTQAGASGASPADGTMLVELDWRTVVTFLVAGLAVLAVASVARSVPRTLTWLVIGGLLALALDPVVGRLAERLGDRRRAAVGVVLAVMVLGVVVIGVLLGPETIRQARSLQSDIPDVAEQLTDLPFVGDRLAEEDAPAKVEDWIDGLPDRLAGNSTAVEGAARSTASGLLAGFVTLLFTVTLLLDGQRLVRGVRRLVPPADRVRADRIGRLLYEIIGRYFAGSVLVAVLHGLYVLVLGLILGVPLAPLLALWAMVFNLVPQIGGAIAGIPFVLLAVTQGLVIGIIALVLFVLYLNLENHVITPIVVGRALDLSPLATMVGAIVGVSVAGVPGALVAVPLMGASKAVYREVRPDPDDTSSDDEEHRLPGGHLLDRLRARFRARSGRRDGATAVAAVAIAVLLVGACGGGSADDDPVPSSTTASTAANAANGTTGDVALAEGVPNPCALVTVDEVVAATGAEIVSTQFGARTPQSAVCDHIVDADGTVGVSVTVTAQDGSQEVSLYEDFDASQTVADLGDQAVWAPEVSTLAVLSGTTAVTVQVTSSDADPDVEAQLDQATELATLALSRL